MQSHFQICFFSWSRRVVFLHVDHKFNPVYMSFPNPATCATTFYSVTHSCRFSYAILTRADSQLPHFHCWTYWRVAERGTVPEPDSSRFTTCCRTAHSTSRPYGFFALKSLLHLPSAPTTCTLPPCLLRFEQTSLLSDSPSWVQSLQHSLLAFLSTHFGAYAPFKKKPRLRHY